MKKPLIFLILAIGSWFAWKQHRLNEELRAKNAKLQAHLDSDEGRLSAEVRAQKAVIADLKKQRAAEQAEIDHLNGDLHSAESLGFDHSFQNHEQDEKKRRWDEIHALEAGLAQVRAQEADLQSGGKQAHALNQANEKATRAQLEQQIHDYSERIKSEKAQINELRKARFDPDSQNRATAMQGDVANDEQTLGQLKAERNATGANFGAVRAQSDAQNRDALTAAHQSEASIKAQIDEEKAAIKQIDQSLGSESRSEKDNRDAQNQLKTKLAAHQSRAAELDGRIREENAKLDVIEGRDAGH